MCASHPFRAGVCTCWPVHLEVRTTARSKPVERVWHICAIQLSLQWKTVKAGFIFHNHLPVPHHPPSLLPIKQPWRLAHEFYLPIRLEYSDATMLTLIQLIFLLFWTSVSFAGAEKLYHHRDHSDMQHFDSHQARLITNEHAAKV